MSDDAHSTGDTDRFAYIVRAGGRYVLTEDYSLAYEYATGRRLDGEWVVDEATGEERISIVHTRGHGYVLDLSDDEGVIENQEACLNRRYDCGHVAYGPPKRLPAECPECDSVATDGGVEQQDIADEFVQEHAVPIDEAESFVHIGIDDHYHPAGGYWFPTGEKWGDASGWVSSKYDIPSGDIIQFPCSEREPERRGYDELPDYVVNRTLSTATEQDGGRDD